MTPTLSPTEANALPQFRRSGFIQVDKTRCLTCRECEMACSLAHEGVCNPELSRIRIDFDDFSPGLPEIRACKQCDFPACAYACQSRWGDKPALTIDERTGARVINPDLCRGCGACARACPLTPERQVIHFRKVDRKRVYFKCDLCSDREDGPVCVAICPGNALTYIPAEERRR